MENKVSKVIRLLIGAFVLFQAAMSFYILIPLLLTYYRTESPFLIPWFSLVVGGILGAISGVGILLRRKWGDITYLFFSIYPLLLLVLTPVLGLKINSSLTATTDGVAVIEQLPEGRPLEKDIVHACSEG